jgi:hypothetical protein
MKGRAMRISIGMLAGLLVLAGEFAVAQETVPYDGLRAGEEAHQIGETQRQQRLNDQLYLNDSMRARYGWAPSSSVVWYGNAGYGGPRSIDYAYAYSSDRLLSRRARGLYIDRYWSPPISVFEPWPYVPGDIYGYSFPPYVRQSIGQRQFQTGPKRWESHPVYAEEATPVEVAPAESVIAPETERTPAVPEIEAPPPAPPVEGSEKSAAPTEKKPRRYYF